MVFCGFVFLCSGHFIFNFFYFFKDSHFGGCREPCSTSSRDKSICGMSNVTAPHNCKSANSKSLKTRPALHKAASPFSTLQQLGTLWLLLRGRKCELETSYPANWTKVTKAGNRKLKLFFKKLRFVVFFFFVFFFFFFLLLVSKCTWQYKRISISLCESATRVTTSWILW